MTRHALQPCPVGGRFEDCALHRSFAVPRVAVHIYPSTFQHESRMLRAIRATLEAGFADEVHVFATAGWGLPAEECRMGMRVHRLPLPAAWLPRALSVPLWARRVASAAAALKPTLVQAHALSVLRASRSLARHAGARLIYDAHELETERAGCSPLVRTFLRWEESSLMPAVDCTLVVGDSIAQHYRERYRAAKVRVVRNVPDAVSAPCREHRDGPLRFGYVGNLVNGRSLRQIVLAARAARADFSLEFIGDGRLRRELESLASNDPRIRFTGPVSPDQVAEATSRLDVGLCLIEEISLSYRLACPNKLFEYMHAGVAVLGSTLPDIRVIVEGSGIGWCITEAGIKGKFESLTRADVRALAIPLEEAARKYCWRNEREELLKALAGSAREAAA